MENLADHPVSLPYLFLEQPWSGIVEESKPGRQKDYPLKSDPRTSLLVDVSFDIPLYLQTNRMGNRLSSTSFSSHKRSGNRRGYTHKASHSPE